MDAEQYQKLAIAILAAIPLDLDSEIADEWTRDPLGLTTALREALASKKQDHKWKPHLFEKLDKQITELNLTTRALGALLSTGPSWQKNEAVIFVGQLVQLSKQKLLTRTNFGRVSLENVVQELGHLGLHLDMYVQGWIPPDQRNK